MEIGKNGIELIKFFEGFRANAYLCPANVLTIGYGHTKTVKIGQKITEIQGEKLLKEDLFFAVDFVNYCKLKVNQNQFDALVSFVFNCGSGNFAKSTLLRKAITDPNNPTIASEFLKWNKGGGKVLNGLTKRRKAEAELYFKQI